MRVALGVYRDRYGFRVMWRDRGRLREKRFPLDTPLDTLKAFRARQTKIAGPKMQTRGLARDVVTFLRTRKSLPTFKSDRAHLRAWLQRFPHRNRWTLTRTDVQLAIAGWEGQGYSAREIRHRVRVLKQLYVTLDPDQPTPCDHVRLPALPKPRPVPVSDTIVRDVAVKLRAAEITKRLRDSKTRARYLVLATTGQRPAQVMRAKPDDVDLQNRVWIVRPAKGDAGTLIALNDDMAAAWALFRQANAWGRFNQRSFVKTLRRNGWPAGVRPYALRHSVGMALSAASVDLGDIQAHMGHQSPQTTRTFYVPALLARQQAASATIEGRLGPSAILPSVPTQDCQHDARRKGESAPESATIRTPGKVRISGGTT